MKIILGLLILLTNIIFAQVNIYNDFFNPSNNIKVQETNFFNSPIRNNFYLSNKPQHTTDETLKIDSLLAFSLDGYITKLTFNYNSKDLVKDFTFWYYFSGQWDKSFRVAYEYDSTNLILTEKHENWNIDEWHNDVLIEYNYDSFHNNIRNARSVWRDSIWSLQGETLFFFDSLGNNIKSTSKIRNGDQMINFSRTFIHYNNENVLDTILYQLWNSSEWRNYWQIIRFYDENGNNNLIINKKWINSQWTNNLKLEIVRDLKPNLVVGYLYSWAFDDWQLLDRYVYEYNDKQYFRKGTYDTWNGNSWVPSDGSIDVINPDGFEVHFLTHEIKVFYNIGTTGVSTAKNELPVGYSLEQNYPNPFNPSTEIKYELPRSAFVKLKIYDLLGNEVETLVDEYQERGSYEVNFNAGELSSGVYIYRIKVGNYINARKMMLIK